ncbi:MAG: surface-adhesin E family protein [Burkholderiales bacterium]
MNRLLLLLTMLCVSQCISSNALAKVTWVRLGEDARVEIFIDSHNIARPPDYVKFWTLLQYKSGQPGGWRSEKRLFVFSCKNHWLEWQQSMYYFSPHGEGELLDVRTLNKYGIGKLLPRELDPSTGRDESNYKDAVPESAFISVFNSLC